MSGRVLGADAVAGRATMVYELQWSAEATAEIRLVPTYRRGLILAAVSHLRHEPLTETLHRKPLAELLIDLPRASWELRVGDCRVFYEVEAVEEVQTVTVLRVILKGSGTTVDAVARSGRRR